MGKKKNRNHTRKQKKTGDRSNARNAINQLTRIGKVSDTLKKQIKKNIYIYIFYDSCKQKKTFMWVYMFVNT